MSEDRSVRGAPRVALRTLGCKVNQVESETYVTDLGSRGFSLTDPECSDVVIINSCCVTGDAEKKVRKAVRRALRTDTAPYVIVTGCLATIDPAGLRSLGERVIVEPDKAFVVDLVAELVGADAAVAPHGPVRLRVGEGFHTRVMVKVEDGCDVHCAYCIVPKARGNPRSMPIVDVVDEARALVEAGVAEVVLTGVNIGRYADGGRDLVDLVEAVAGTGIGRLRISSIEPPYLTQRLVYTLGALDAVCPHLHVPLQSGSSRVLERMGRGYDPAAYLRVVERAREVIPGLAVTTDVMTGFPGETEWDMLDTIDLLQRLWGTVSRLHVFRYSERPGTRATEMSDSVPLGIREERARDIREFGDLMSTSYRERRVGERAQVLVERVIDGVGEGTSEDYLKVRIAHPDLVAGRVQEVVLCGTDGSHMTVA